jgi:signal transduction histidine kinase
MNPNAQAAPPATMPAMPPPVIDRRRSLSETTVEAILDCAPDAILVLDDTLRVRKANRAAIAMGGRGVEGLIGSCLRDWIGGRQRAALLAGIARLLRTASGEAGHGRALRRELTIRVGRGREQRVDATVSALRMEGQSLLIVILRDLGDTLRARHALAESKGRLEAALAAMADGVAISDNEGRFIAFNEAFARFHRLPDRQACPPTVADFVPLIEAFEPDGSPVPPEQWLLHRALRGESGTQRVLQLRRRDSGERWYAAYSYAPVRDAEGTIIGAVVSARDITEMRLAQQTLEQYSQSLRALVAQMHAVEETERQRIARDLHDELQQKLAAISLDLASLGEALQGARAAAVPLLRDLETLVGRAIEATRRIVRDLRPQLLDELGLSAALESMGANFETRTGIRTEIELLGAERADAVLGPLPAAALYRVAQEALNNVLKHARASFVHLMLDACAPHQVELSITDDGVGIDLEERTAQRSYGLQGMAERLRALGGRLVVAPQPEGGTVVQAIVPTEGWCRRRDSNPHALSGTGF